MEEDCIHACKSSVFPKSCTGPEKCSAERGMVKILSRFQSLAVTASPRKALQPQSKADCYVFCLCLS